MQDRFSQLLPILGAIVAFLIAALLVLYIIRLLFGRRIRSSAKKGLRRLDVVDVFDLDRERQLVIVRRDDTEHLLLIGGPNDLLVEGSIARSDALAAERAREARPAPAPVAWPAGPSEPLSPPPPAGPALKPAGGQVNLPPDLFAPAPSKPGPGKPTAPEPAPAAPAAPPPAASAPPPAPPAAPPPRPASPAPARPVPPRPATPPFLARTQRVIQPKGEPQPPQPAAAPATPPSPPSPQARPAPPIAPSMRPPAAPPPAAPPQPAPPPAPAPAAPPPEVDPLESLEAEMARLLGRPEKE